MPLSRTEITSKSWEGCSTRNSALGSKSKDSKDLCRSLSHAIVLRSYTRESLFW